jgi:hypothetical protein
MSVRFVNWLRDRFCVKVATLGLGVLLALAVSSPVAVFLGGSDGFLAAATAAAVCLAGAELALLATLPFRDPKAVWMGALLAMLPRMGIPLLAAILFSWHGGALADAGVLYYLVVFYPVTLTLETILLAIGGTSCRPVSKVSS